MIANTPWSVVVGFPKDIVLASARNFLRWNMIAGAIVLAIGFFTALILSRRITRPVNKLTDAASLIASGDYSQQVEVDRSDEIGKLARAFNSMMVQIRQSQLNLENKVKERTSQLEQSNKELEAFSYSVSHDLRAPLRIIHGYSNILTEDYSGKLDAEGNRMLTIIAENAVKMGLLIDDLLNLSRFGRKPLLLHEADMNQMVHDIIDEQRDLRAAKQYMKISELDTAYCDGGLMKQVWINLISNAVKYSAKKTLPVIEISSLKQGNDIIYSVRDNGVGFDMKYVDKLFGVFQRLHGSNEFEGTGVGLALVQRIVMRHGGKVWAEAEPDKGATFYFTIPIKVGTHDMDPPTQQTIYYGNVIS
jgi:light-regulated signal transduction histidine kinase (bacteriophytochrome)